VEKRFGYCEYSHIINIATYCESDARAQPKPLDFLHKAPTLSLTEAEKPCRGSVSDEAKRFQNTGIKAEAKKKSAGTPLATPDITTIRRIIVHLKNRYHALFYKSNSN
jgi:hypothetical protein